MLSFKQVMISLKNWKKYIVHLEREVLRGMIILAFLAVYFGISQRCPLYKHPLMLDAAFMSPESCGPPLQRTQCKTGPKPPSTTTLNRLNTSVGSQFRNTGGQKIKT